MKTRQEKKQRTRSEREARRSHLRWRGDHARWNRAGFYANQDPREVARKLASNAVYGKKGRP